MLVVSRKPGQRIVIGENITITIVRVDHQGSVRLGIEAPREIPVAREEVYRPLVSQELAIQAQPAA